MQAAQRDNLTEFQTIISKMPLEVCCQAVLPELGLRWRVVTQAVRNARLPMTSASVGKILKKYVAYNLEPAELDEIVAQLRIKLVASSTSRNWHTIKLLEQTLEDEPVAVWTQKLVSRVHNAARNKGLRVKVHSSKIVDFIYLSVEKVSARSSPLYAAVTASQPVAFVSTLGASGMIKAVVEGLGYKKYASADLHGPSLASLLRIADRGWNVHATHLADPPLYEPLPVFNKNDIDYTNKAYNAQYVDSIIGPDPPLLNSLNIVSDKPFYDSERLNKNISVSVSIKSNDLAKTFKSWVAVKAIAPTSEFLKIFHHIKTNSFTYNLEGND